MNSDRKEPRLSSLEQTGKQERIPTLSERVAPDLFEGWEPQSRDGGGDGESTHLHPDSLHTGAADMFDDDETTPRLDDYDFIDELTGEQAPEPQAHDAEPEAEGARMAAPDISAEDIETLSDRVLDQIAPALREAVTAAVTELLAAHRRDDT